MEIPAFLRTLPIAHRGLHSAAIPENSIPAFRAAIEHGYAIETDVHFTKNGRLVVFHDDNLFRMTGDERNIKDCTVSELKRLRLGGTDEQIPLFREFLKEVAGRVPLLIEIKNMAGVKAKRVAAALSEALEGYEGEYAVQSFNPFYVKAYKKLHPEVACGVLGIAQKGAAKGIQAYVIKHLCFNFAVRPDFISYCFEDLPRRKITKFKGARLAWVVRSSYDETRARQYADNIIFENYLPKLS